MFFFAEVILFIDTSRLALEIHNVRLAWHDLDFFFYSFNDTATTEIYTLSLHDALPISRGRAIDAGEPRAASRSWCLDSCARSDVRSRTCRWCARREAHGSGRRRMRRCPLRYEARRQCGQRRVEPRWLRRLFHPALPSAGARRVSSMSTIGSRKADHIALCSDNGVAFRARTTLLEQVQFIHDALPDLDCSEIDLSCSLFGKRLRAPIVIAAMTGGTDEAGSINRSLAEIAEGRGYAFALGSQRAMHVRPVSRSSFQVRDVAPSIPILGNIGVVQARAMATSAVQELVDAVSADALCIHLNPAMELVQPGGDRDFSGGLDTIARLANELTVPVVVKETGCGLSRSVGERVRRVGVRYADVSGAGGTSWVGVETKRAKEAGDARSLALGEVFWDWGVPTAASVAQLAPLGFEAIIATGGVMSGVDAARAIALGATAAGIARPVLMALREGGRAGAIAFFDRVERELRAVMLLSGSRDVAALRRARKIIGGELRRWVEDHE